MDSDREIHSEKNGRWKNIPVYLLSVDEKNKLLIKGSVTFGLLLRSNLSTGFSWGLVNSDKIEVVSFIETADYESGNNELKRFGSGDFEMFVFKTIKSGETELEFIYFRPWEKDKEPEKKVMVKISIINKD